uniref:Thiol:disulfide interchange protein n=1 Tax=Lophocladia kuetzingii TaxID=675577 RepID=A0A1Z1MNX9_9FLOR|nr:thiol:disulfide interchange protein [Lophocladia kuetzingii]ARW67569.1 thiol:disulfide interchange protein [Lophocladia kuetzingii]
MIFTFFNFNYFFDKYEIYLYLLQQQLSQLLVQPSQYSYFFTFIIFLFFGFLTICSPCFLSIIPLVISYINSQVNQNFNKILFILGLISSFMSIIYVNKFLNYYIFSSILPIFFSFILCLFSLNLMQIFDISFISIGINRYIGLFKPVNQYIQNYLMGIVLGFSSIPCNTSIIFIFTFFIKNLSNSLDSLVYSFAYLLGIFCPLLIIFNIKFLSRLISLLSFYWNFIIPLSGSFIFISSLYSILSKLFI